MKKQSVVHGLDKFLWIVNLYTTHKINEVIIELFDKINVLNENIKQFFVTMSMNKREKYRAHSSS